MRSLLLTSAFVGLTIAFPRPQDINIDGVEAAGNPSFATVPVDKSSDQPSVVLEAVVASSAAVAIATAPATAKRSNDVTERDGTCVVQPAGSGPVASPDTVSAFYVLQTLKTMSSSTPTPDGYALAFQGYNGSLSASNYMGMYTITSYDSLACAPQCDQASGCERDSFEVVMTGSNGYNKDSPPDAIDGFVGPQELGGAINAPLDSQGHNTYMGNKYYPFSQSQELKLYFEFKLVILWYSDQHFWLALHFFDTSLGLFFYDSFKRYVLDAFKPLDFIKLCTIKLYRCSVYNYKLKSSPFIFDNFCSFIIADELRLLDNCRTDHGSGNNRGLQFRVFFYKQVRLGLCVTAVVIMLMSMPAVQLQQYVQQPALS
ncbi:hypothetical protein AOQ84DRAFT_382668 [Glonium stellatum]|uniref:Uncharacterized protein n=1 Tax=Glonium stellatum TaxID=574774 RepID=A0A8E2EPM1_9PEZI|nr:hypothetical protein AOQ84DRAFT_382668 [Glonium stellatum]